MPSYPYNQFVLAGARGAVSKELGTSWSFPRDNDWYYKADQGQYGITNGSGFKRVVSGTVFPRGYDDQSPPMAFVAIDNKGRMFFSYDGISWTQSSIGQYKPSTGSTYLWVASACTSGFRDVMYHGNLLYRFIAITEDGAPYESADGYRWQIVTPQNRNFDRFGKIIKINDPFGKAQLFDDQGYVYNADTLNYRDTINSPSAYNWTRLQLPLNYNTNSALFGTLGQANLPAVGTLDLSNVFKPTAVTRPLTAQRFYAFSSFTGDKGVGLATDPTRYGYILIGTNWLDSSTFFYSFFGLNIPDAPKYANVIDAACGQYLDPVTGLPVDVVLVLVNSGTNEAPQTGVFRGRATESSILDFEYIPLTNRPWSRIKRFHYLQGGGKFFITMQQDTSNPVLATSSDGATWTYTNVPYQYDNSNKLAYSDIAFGLLDQTWITYQNTWTAENPNISLPNPILPASCNIVAPVSTITYEKSLSTNTHQTLPSSPFASKIRPIKPGYSVSSYNYYIGNDPNFPTGTIAGFFKDPDGDVVALCTNSSCSSLNNASVGDLVYQPSLIDCVRQNINTSFVGWGSTDHPIESLPYFGTVKKFIPLKQVVKYGLNATSNYSLGDMMLVKVHPSFIEAGLIDPTYPNGKIYKISKGNTIYNYLTGRSNTTDILNYVSYVNIAKFTTDPKLTPERTAIDATNGAVDFRTIIPGRNTSYYPPALANGNDPLTQLMLSGTAGAYQIPIQKWGRSSGYTTGYINYLALTKDLNTIANTGIDAYLTSSDYDKRAGTIIYDKLIQYYPWNIEAANSSSFTQFAFYFTRFLKINSSVTHSVVKILGAPGAKYNLAYRRPTATEMSDNKWLDLIDPNLENKLIATITIPSSGVAVYYTPIQPFYIKCLEDPTIRYTGNPATGITQDYLPRTEPFILPGDGGSLIFLEDMTIAGMLIGGICTGMKYQTKVTEDPITISNIDYNNPNVVGYVLPFYDILRVFDLRPFII